jgi:lactoylglutathione lyase
MHNETAAASGPSIAPETAPPSAAIRIAVASREGDRIDQHFGHAKEFIVYDVGAAGPALIGRRAVDAFAENEDEDPREVILRMLADCKVLLVAKIGPTPQEQMAAIGVEASDMYAGKSVESALAQVFAEKAAARADGAVDSSGFRMMHAMLRVSDMERSLDFYTRLLGMRVLELREHKKNSFSQAYLGYGDGFDQMTLELVFNWIRDEPYAMGESFGHIAILVTGITALCNRLAAEGVPMPRPPRAQRHHENIVAFVEDPDGHRIELVQLPAAS